MPGLNGLEATRQILTKFGDRRGVGLCKTHCSTEFRTASRPAPQAFAAIPGFKNQNPGSYNYSEYQIEMWTARLKLSDDACIHGAWKGIEGTK